GETHHLLEDISGYVAPGKLTALMRESGAGKVSGLQIWKRKSALMFYLQTMLLNVLAERQAAGYVQQMDTHLAQTTVRKALLFSAKLRQSPTVPLKEKEAYVDTVLKMCGLAWDKYADAVVG
ncbi:hypothetical protein H4582DRAFT_1795813, partial [Lactarius indigo]